MKGGKHLILVGLPGSGKSTVGKWLAELLSLPFTDLDGAIEAKIGQTIPRYFAGHGEAAFRDVESAALRQALERPSQIIATGGGVVLRPENLRALRRNGRLIFLNRSLSKLRSSPDRPLSATQGQLKALYEARFPLYQAAAELQISADGDPGSVVRVIRKELGL